MMATTNTSMRIMVSLLKDIISCFEFFGCEKVSNEFEFGEQIEMSWGTNKVSRDANERERFEEVS